MVNELKSPDSIYPAICDLIQLSSQKYFLYIFRALRSEIANSHLLEVIVNLFYSSNDNRIKAGLIYILINLSFDPNTVEILCLNCVVELLSIYGALINTSEVPLNSDELWNHPESDYALQFSCIIGLASIAEVLLLYY